MYLVNTCLDLKISEVLMLRSDEIDCRFKFIVTVE